MTDAEIEKAAAAEPDAAPILYYEQMRCEYQPHPAPSSLECPFPARL